MAPQEMNEDFDLPSEEKEFGRQDLEKKNKKKRLKVKDIPKNGDETPPLDIMENIVPRLHLLDRIHLSVLCKYWSWIAMRRDIRSTAPLFPWTLDFLVYKIDPDNEERFVEREAKILFLGLDGDWDDLGTGLPWTEKKDGEGENRKMENCYGKKKEERSILII
ncbi:F-box protein [Pyrus ussuriensis x Pyrus communis]|uniref:F-box protein n=1 Tax=Pyrus ussuriensis x Pyrus communis TaxID=2448454 RepID=A0A5N5G4L5_9ROSA|nr:F-box protein [Pyrus ussuriensis x Pyrus communis]